MPVTGDLLLIISVQGVSKINKFMKIRTIILITFMSLLLASCGSDEPTPTVAPAAAIEQLTTETAVSAESAAPPPPVSTLVPTAIPPTPTVSEPLAALVNGEPIYLAAYEEELARYEQSQVELGTAVSDYRTVVLDTLIKQLLVVQAARESGFEVTEAMIDERLAEYRKLVDDPENFEAWLEVNLWTETEFRDVLLAELAEIKMVENVTSNVPLAVEQVHARYLQVNDAALADQLLTQIRNGDDFAFLAQQHSLDRLTGENGGDLDFFARGSLLIPEVETAAFALEPGGVSDVITATSIDGSETVYYIVQVIEKDPQRPLPADLRYELMQQTFQTWLDSLWQQAVIEKYVQ